ncbi:MAG: Uncharacterised protein [Alphaproteobacteria bacterium]|nr:MAG: Uncharacterised protein [Alphaproteobacteria bacterium]
MYDTYIYLSYAATFVPLAVLIGVSFRQLSEARRLAQLLAEAA